MAMQQDSEASAGAQKWAEQFSQTITCPECGGTRLKEALYYRIADKNIAELTAMDIDELYQWLIDNEPKLSSNRTK